ncbi:DNA-methyltransferase [Clostridium saccharobutylicum]|uniref:Methyltransferase n=1 Tax=Clostridium saccharobutylicum DSM 13864 TaxID=1345695 RepID=U5MX11_CLOSA|nr:DNA methyltransferase [Clostridium saccharobutylicum]AGX43972.1 DNA methylase [Clostridium saccharobutylicum DSM 13864]AQR91269.1 modification methylase DpnIIB [Clostridium saccharobutylicum]AQS01173.1 modification methylase DpnIIB [Clostridium saccharobutylicum]AQS15156.1 modification methylase DpnIIB [Clostridium saccharobutylicum]MBA2905283.1 site-specific DNA-methyltransferase (adenine-specific) [Clostridium saccharobutylicum]
MFELNRLYNMDCMEGMKQIPDKYFDLAIVDPPYFKGPNKRQYYGRRVNKLKIKRKDYSEIKRWDVPNEQYFKELLRVSKNQIIWGINYYDFYLGPGRIIWDKVNGKSSYSDCEIAYCSTHDSTKLFRYMWNGMNQGKSISEGHIMLGDKSKNEKRIHPTQKPINLYKWLLMNYAKQGDKILDTHVGSASSLVACHEMEFDFLGFELDKNMYELASNRLEEVMNQISMFNII